MKAINAVDVDGNTPMHMAVEIRSTKIFTLLLESKKAHLCIMNKNGLTPRDLSMAQQNVSGFMNWQVNYIIIFSVINILVFLFYNLLLFMCKLKQITGYILHYYHFWLSDSYCS